MIRRIAVVMLMAGLSACGHWFAGDDYIQDAKRRAANPNLSPAQKGRIYEEAGDAAAIRGHRGYADEMYSDAALEYHYSMNSPEGDAGVRRIQGKCADIRMQSGPGCSMIPELIDERATQQRSASAARSPAQARGTDTSGAGPSYIIPGRPGAGQASQPARPTPPPSAAPDIDEAIRQAKAKLAIRPRMIDGCPTRIEHLAPELPVCPDNAQLTKLRELILATDASFVDDQAAGHSLRQVATNAAQAARQTDESLRSAEISMLEASASADLARRRLDALKGTPPRCDAAPQGSFGMSENAYQAYVSMFMATKANRAVSAVAACRARARP